MGVLPFVLAYQVISPLVMGETVGIGYVSMRVIGVLICPILQAVLYGWGLDVHMVRHVLVYGLERGAQAEVQAGLCHQEGRPGMGAGVSYAETMYLLRRLQ